MFSTVAVAKHNILAILKLYENGNKRLVNDDSKYIGKIQKWVKKPKEPKTKGK